MGKSVALNRMHRFAEVYASSHVSVRANRGRTWLEIDDPAILASFIAFCKIPLDSRGIAVYLRGQSRWHSTVVCSLLRGADQKRRVRRWAAYQQFLRGLPRVVRGTRFTAKNFGAVLQHYGFRTPWLDVVDDLHAAIWFALNNCSETGGECFYERTTADHGWIAVVAVPKNGHVLNLRNRQSSRNVRCHAQQGFSLAMQYDDTPVPGSSQDFMPDIVGAVRVPNTARWQLRGHRASQEYFFPPPTIDDTYRQLLGPGVTALARRAEKEHGLRTGTLGRAARYRSIKTAQPSNEVLQPSAHDRSSRWEPPSIK